MKSGVKVTLDNMKNFVAGVEALASTRVMVGIPSDRAERDDEEGKGETINSAALGYIHDNGAPEVNIPPRPWLGAGIKEAKGKIVEGLKKAGQLAFEGKPDAVERQFHRVGAIGRDAAKRKITTGPFVPLKPRTIAKRRRRSKGSKYRRKAMAASDVSPLIDTAQMRNAVNYVLKKAKKK